MKTTTFLLAVVALSAVPLRGDQIDFMIGLGTLTPFPSGPGAYARPAHLYPLASGFVSEGDTATSAVAELSGVVAYELAQHSSGMVVSEQTPNFSIGDYLSDIPADTPEDIDWEKTRDGILESGDYLSGNICYLEGMANAAQRILFTGGGAVSVKWHYRNGDEPKTLIYQVKSCSTERPNRIFWTNAPFNAPGIDLNGKFVRLFGPSEIVTPVYAESGTAGVSNIVKGVFLDESSHTLQAYAKVIDVDSQQFDGPVGQFVVCYYTSGKMDEYIGHVVVEVSGPDVKILTAHVGEELLPTGDGWSIDGLRPYVQKGVSQEDGDAASPHLHLADLTDANGDVQRIVYAISPTDKTANADGRDTPASADIYWEKPDMMGTLWPFEEDWYLVGWDPNAPVVVYGDSGVGVGLFVPTNLTVTVCDYQKPMATASVSGQEVSVSKSGYFTLKLSDDDGRMWYRTFRSLPRTHREVCNADAGKYDIVQPVGAELRPLDAELTGSAADAFSRVSPIPGYIYREGSVSGGRNWNVILYRDPVAPTLVDSGTSGVSTSDSEEETNPFADLESSICSVGASDVPIEVWWRGEAMASSRLYGAVKIAEYPTAVARYLVRGAVGQDWPEIAVVSGKGSMGDSVGLSSQGVYLRSAESGALLTEGDVSLGESGFTFGVWMKAAPEEFSVASVTPGHVLSMELSGSVFELVSTGDYGDGQTGFRFTVSEDVTNEVWTGVFHVANDRWGLMSLTVGPVAENSRHVALAMDGQVVAEGEIGGTAFVGAGGVLVLGAMPGDPSAAGLALDDIRLYGRTFAMPEWCDVALEPYSTESGAAMPFACWDFEPGSVGKRSTMDESTVTYVLDRCKSRGLTFVGDTRIFPKGALVKASGTEPVRDGIAPAVYRQPDRTKDGYHPNVAHAFASKAEVGDGYATWAVRCDLATDPGDDGLVFTMYNNGGKGAQAVRRVVFTNHYYSAYSSLAVAGNELMPPAPLRLLDGYRNPHTQWASLKCNSGDDKSIVYRDRKATDWARRDGGGFAFYHYMKYASFDMPEGVAVADGSYLPWLSCVRGYSATDVTAGTPLPWYWSVSWPSAAGTPSMRVGQTLTKAVDGLPEVYNMASCGVIYPRPGITGNVGGKSVRKDVVTLIDPTVAQKARLPITSSFVSEYGFKLGNSGTCQLRKGKYHFTGLPPSVSDRFYVDTNEPEDSRLVLVGNLVEPATGKPYMQLNVLTATERQALKDICLEGSPKKAQWDAGIDSLATAPVLAAAVSDKSVSSWNNRYAPWVGDARVVTNELSRLDTVSVCGLPCTLVSTSVVTSVSLASESGVADYVTYDGAFRPEYVPVDHYALMALGNDAGFVTIIENDSDDTSVVADGDPVNVKVIRVLPELYSGSISVLADPMNKLSEKLTIQYNEPIVDAAENFSFEWRRKTPEANGSVDTNFEGWQWTLVGDGLTSFLVGTNGTQLTELVNTYYVMRYQAKAGSAAELTLTDGTAWSRWTDYTLAEGWVQRVLNSITPFAQRVEDFYSNKSDIWYTMFEQIGRPYTGDVALNNGNLAEVGLLELYQTVLNKAEKMSLTVGVNDIDVNKQLLLAASRLADLYMLLGAEAYADAKNPLVSQGLSDTYLGELQNLPSSTFCFQNQVRTLLDEELALLRGRSNATQSPNMKTEPCFNRLYWNFTKGVTEGEVAYVNNYGIRAEEGVLTVDCAAKQYPQGHGDAWGHYLSAIKGYYRLLRNPNFNWTPSMMEMMVSQSVVNEDYTDENKFADAALKLAQCGLDVVDLTARKAWRDNGGDFRAAYFDNAAGSYPSEADPAVTVSQNFGYGETAARVGLGAIYNWAVVNSLLPTNDAPARVYADAGISQITRETATQLPEICTVFNSLQQRVNALDSGLNPLGLSQNAVPMDIDPDRLADRNSHFDQILERAERALQNCSRVLDYANRHGARLQQIQNAETTAGAEQQKTEADFNRELIAIYGTPYADDIGPGKTYGQGYEGPDLYHYNYIDLNEFGIETKALSTDFVLVMTNKKYNASSNLGDNGIVDGKTVTVTYTIADNGIYKKPANWTGRRATEGRLQEAYRAFVSAYVTADGAKLSYASKVAKLQTKYAKLQKQYRNKAAETAKKEILNVYKGLYSTAKYASDLEVAALDALIADAADKKELVLAGIPKVQILGMSTSIDPKSVVEPVLGAQQQVTKAVLSSAKYATLTKLGGMNLAKDLSEEIWDSVTQGVDLYDKMIALEDSASSLAGDVNSAIRAYQEAVRALSAAEAEYRKIVYEGDLLLEERERVRKQQSNAATACRYADMYNRVQRNNALTKYSTSFDTAQRYVWELAKVYDYETGLLSSDPDAGAKFLSEIVGARQLGYEGVSSSSATDKGLYDIVHRMKENWASLKGRLGVNNPDNTATEFSLRYELFRIKPDAQGDAAWKQELRKYWVDNILDDADFRRFCQPPTSSSASVVREPGLVIPFATSINNAENFFGRTLQGGDHAFSSSDYSTKISAVGITFVGHDRLTTQTVNGLAHYPNVYLVPVGRDYMRSPADSDCNVFAWSVVDQVLPLPYVVGSTELDDEDWISTFSGMDGTSDSYAKIRRHSTLRADGSTYSTRLVGRSVWNDRWLLVIPGSALNANREQGLETFINGVSDIKLGIKAYSRSGN
jgi:hypothetical protein